MTAPVMWAVGEFRVLHWCHPMPACIGGNKLWHLDDHLIWCPKVDSGPHMVGTLSFVQKGQTSGCSLIVASTASTAYCIHCILHPLCTVSTASNGLTFLQQRQCSHHHILLFHCVHCIHWFDLLAPKTMSPPPYTTIPLHPLHTASTVSTASLHSLHT